MPAHSGLPDGNVMHKTRFLFFRTPLFSTAQPIRASAEPARCGLGGSAPVVFPPQNPSCAADIACSLSLTSASTRSCVPTLVQSKDENDDNPKAMDLSGQQPHSGVLRGESFIPRGFHARSARLCQWKKGAFQREHATCTLPTEFEILTRMTAPFETQCHQ